MKILEGNLKFETSNLRSLLMEVFVFRFPANASVRSIIHYYSSFKLLLESRIMPVIIDDIPVKLKRYE